MSFTTAEGRQQLLDSLAAAAERIGVALAALTEAYEQLDENGAERLEQEVFRPVQTAYGRAVRAYSGFTQRHGLPAREFRPAAAMAPSHGVKGLVELAIDACAGADATLSALQDSMLPVEVGDAELRAGLEEVRVLLDRTGARARELVRTFGR